MKQLTDVIPVLVQEYGVTAIVRALANEYAARFELLPDTPTTRTRLEALQTAAARMEAA